MLLNKKIKLVLFLFTVLVMSSIVYSQQQTCTTSEIKDALRQALFDYFGNPTTSKLSVNEIKDFLHFYLSTDTSQLVVDCGGSGPLSGKPYYLMLGVAKKIGKSIPKCGDGTEYGKCSSNVPNYCYGGKLEERCKLCGCGENQQCDVSTNKCVPSSAAPGEGKKDKVTLMPPLNPPKITNINPTSGNKYTKVTLTGAGFTSTDNSINWDHKKNAIKDLTSDGTTITFNALHYDCPRKSCLVSVTNSQGTSNSVFFNITKKPVKTKHKGPPTVQILTPNGGERFVQGKDKIPITWNGGKESVVLMVWYRDSMPYNEQDEFYYSTDWYIIAKDLPPSGSFEWDGKVCSWFDANDCHSISPGFKKVIAISEDKKGEQITYDTVSDPNHDNWDESDNPFLIVSTATISSLKVISPNGEEKWIQDEDQGPGTLAPIVFDLKDFVENSATNYYPLDQVYSVNLLKGGKFYHVLMSGTYIPSPYTFSGYIQNGSDYTVEIIFHGPNGDIKDVSDKTFSIGTVPGVVAVRGKLLDKFTNSPNQLPDGYYFGGGWIYPGTRSDGTKFSAIGTDYWNGNFAFGMSTDDASIATQKAFYNREEAISTLPIWVSKKPDNTYEVLADVIDQNQQPLRADVINSEANLGRVTAWTAAYLILLSDVPVTYSVEYEQDGLAKKGPTTLITTGTYAGIYSSIYQSELEYNLIPLNYNTRVKLVDNAGKEYYSPYINLGLEYTRWGATLNFKNGVLTWNIPPNYHLSYPNGGEFLRSGNTETIKWECVNFPAGYTCNPTVDIYLTGSNSGYWDLFGTYFDFDPATKIATVTGRSYNWTIPAGTYGSHRILVTNMGIYNYGIYGRDYSDDPFWIY